MDHDTGRLSGPGIDGPYADAGPQPLRVEVLEEAGLMLELIGNALDRGGRSRRHALERLRRAPPHPGHGIAMRAGLGVAEHHLDALLHLRRHRVLESLGLFVGLPPLESEDLDEETFGEAMAADDRVGVALPALGQMHFFTFVEGDKAIALKSVHHLRHRRGREAKDLPEAPRANVSVLVPERVDGPEVLLD